MEQDSHSHGRCPGSQPFMSLASGDRGVIVRVTLHMFQHPLLPLMSEILE